MEPTGQSVRYILWVCLTLSGSPPNERVWMPFDRQPFDEVTCTEVMTMMRIKNPDRRFQCLREGQEANR